MLMIRCLFQLGNTVLIFYNSSLVFFSLVLHSSFVQCYSLGSSHLVGSMLSIGLENSLIMVPFLIYFLFFFLFFFTFIFLDDFSILDFIFFFFLPQPVSFLKCIG